MRHSEIAGVILILAFIIFIYGGEAAFWAYRISGKVAPIFFGSRYFVIIHILAIAGIAAFIDGFFIEPNWIEVTRFEIETPKLKSSSFRIVLFSDTHCESKPRNEGKAVEIINELKPDVIVFTGDSLNTPDALPLFKKTLRQLDATLGKFAVRGNFDSGYWRNLDLFSQTGFRELASDTVEVRKNSEALCMTGFNVPCPVNYRKVLQAVPDENYSVLLYHFSDLAESLQGTNVDLYLSGHTHGGQFRLPFYGAIVTLSKFGKKYEAGMYEIGGIKLYVNRGLGLENKPAPKIRFLCRPEITVFDIRPASALGPEK
jgi:predicted MPP superfamily phosphohydrolase